MDTEALSGSLKTLDKIFVRQIYEWDCGPVAALNAYCWATGQSIPDKRYWRKMMKDWLKTDREGTNPPEMDKVLKELGKVFSFWVYNDSNLGIRRVTHRLNAGEMLILSHVDHVDHAGDWHYSSWYINKFNKLVGINVRYKSPPTYFSKETLKDFIRTADKDGVRADGYFLKRRKCKL